MDISYLSDKYYVRRLNTDDVYAIYNLCCENHIFYEYHPPFVTKESIAEDMSALPPGKDYDDKYYIGFFDNNILIAVMDLIMGYPDKDTVHIGFFMVDVNHQGRGVGSAIIQHIICVLKKIRYTKIRLGVDKENPLSYSFWRKNGFKVVDQREYVIMEYLL